MYNRRWEYTPPSPNDSINDEKSDVDFGHAINLQFLQNQPHIYSDQSNSQYPHSLEFYNQNNLGLNQFHTNLSQAQNQPHIYSQAPDVQPIPHFPSTPFDQSRTDPPPYAQSTTGTINQECSESNLFYPFSPNFTEITPTEFPIGYMNSLLSRFNIPKHHKLNDSDVFEIFFNIKNTEEVKTMSSIEFGWTNIEQILRNCESLNKKQ